MSREGETPEPESLEAKPPKASRGKTQSIVRLPKTRLRLVSEAYPESPDWRPRTRADCGTFPRPCPYVSCRHHLALDVNPHNGSIKVNHPCQDEDGLVDVNWDALPASCALDVAEEGGLTLERVGEVMNLTRERARQVEESALAKLHGHALDEGYEREDLL